MIYFLKHCINKAPYNTDEPGEHYADWNKPYRKKQILHGIM